MNERDRAALEAMEDYVQRLEQEKKNLSDNLEIALERCRQAEKKLEAIRRIASD